MLLSGEELTEQLRAACRNVVDTDSAMALLECTLDNFDRVVDVDVLRAVSDAAGPYMDASFVPVAHRMLEQNLPEFRAAAFRVFGFAKDAAKLPHLKKGLDDEDLTARREAIMALGMLGGRDAIGCLNDYLQKGSDFRLLAATMLMRLEVPGAVRTALPLYALHVKRVRDLKCGHFSMHDTLYGGISFKLTRSSRKRLTRQFDKLKRVERLAREDAAQFEALVRKLSQAQIDEAVDVLAETDSANLVPTAYAVFGSLPEKDFNRYPPKLKSAKLQQIRLLAE